MEGLLKFQNALEKALNPVAKWLNENKFVKALTVGFMNTMPITLGVAIIAIAINFPIDAWTALLTKAGLYKVGQDFISVTMSMLAIYVSATIAYAYAKNENKNALIAAVLSLGTFIALMPLQAATIGKTEGVSVLATSNMGSDGFFVAIIVGLFMSWAYCKLTEKNFVLKMPESVPPMVSESMSPVYTAMILFFGVFLVKFLFTLTPFGDAFTAINTIIGKPIMSLGSSATACIAIYVIINIFWFFGVHPNVILSCYFPVLISTTLANQEAFKAGAAMPFATFAILGTIVQIGGAGSTLGLCVATMFAKSDKYKAMRKLVIPANLFNINEPVIFGFPLVMNPIYFIPMVCAPILSGAAGLLMLKFIPVTINPYVTQGTLPWVTPQIAIAFLQGGFALTFIFLVNLALHTVLYLPFFMIDDKNAVKEEEAIAAAKVTEEKEESKEFALAE